MSCFVSSTLGACSPLGLSWPQTWSGLLEGRQGFDSTPPAYHWPVGPLVGRCALPDPEAPYHERMRCLIESVAVQLAPELHAVLNASAGKRLVVILASSHGDPGITTRLRTEPGQANVRGIVFASHAKIITAALGVHGLFTALHGACASGIIALAQAADMLRANLTDHVLIVSTDALSLLAYMGFQAVGAMDPQRCQPFGANGQGMSVGEGALAMLCTRDRLALPEPRGAVSVKGGAWNCDGSGGVEPLIAGLNEAIQAALGDAGIRACDIDFVYWHGTGTKRNDEAELRVCESFWPEGPGPAGAGTKGNLAHTMGASSAFNVAAACETLRTALLPGLPYDIGARYAPLNLARQARTLSRAGNGLCVAMGFGGVNAAVVLGRAES